MKNKINYYKFASLESHNLEYFVEKLTNDIPRHATEKKLYLLKLISENKNDLNISEALIEINKLNLVIENCKKVNEFLKSEYELVKNFELENDDLKTMFIRMVFFGKKCAPCN